MHMPLRMIPGRHYSLRIKLMFIVQLLSAHGRCNANALRGTDCHTSVLCSALRAALCAVALCTRLRAQWFAMTEVFDGFALILVLKATMFHVIARRGNAPTRQSASPSSEGCCCPRGATIRFQAERQTEICATLARNTRCGDRCTLKANEMY